MNRCYRIAWNHRKGVWQAISEAGASTKARGSACRLTIGTAPAAAALGLSLIASHAYAELPSGGTVVAGETAFSSQSNTLTIDQTSQNTAINWERFSIGEGQHVRFNQPNADAAALNRVTGSEVSSIRGALSANGRVFLINPNGVHFSSTARVDVGALVASTLDISTEDFMAGNYTFEGGSGNAVINAGNITSAAGGHVAMIAAEIINTGSIETPQGSTLMGAGSRVTLDLGGPVKIEVEEARLATHIAQGGAIRADGGLVYLTAKAANDLTASVINHTGITQARSLASGEDGQIMLMGDMQSGRVEVAGTLDASAPNGGNGGFIETSAARVSVADEVQVTTHSAHGDTGEWLIDPTDFYINAGSATKTDSDIGADTLSASLANNNITLKTVTTGSEDGDIHVNAAISWDADTRLTLDAHNDININQSITAQNGTLALYAVGDITSAGAIDVGVFDLASGSWRQNSVNLPAFTARDFRIEYIASFLRTLGGSGSASDPYQLTDVYGLQGMASLRLLGNDFVLVSDIDASGTAGWNAGAGFDPIGDISGFSSGFIGSLDGRGHVISDLTIKRPREKYVGLFGATHSASLTGIGLVAADITGGERTGGLVGLQRHSTISESYVSGDVTGGDNVGGLVGENQDGFINQSYTTGDVSGAYSVGGLVGKLSGTISQSYAASNVAGNDWIGGLVGSNNGGSIRQSYATGDVRGNKVVGGLVGASWNTLNTIENSFFATTDAAGTPINHGLSPVGLNDEGRKTNTSGKSHTELQRLSTFDSWGTDIDAEGGTGSVWRIYKGLYDGFTTPLLRAFLTPLDMRPEYDGRGIHQSNIASVNTENWNAADKHHVLGGSLRAGSTLTLTGSDTTGEYLATSDAIIGDFFSDQQGYDLITTRVISDSNLTAIGDIALTHGASWDNGILRIDTAGDIISIGAINGGDNSVFDLASGHWQQTSASLPVFTANDFRLKEDTASFLRTQGGSGNGAAPYQLTDVYGLQGMASHRLQGNDFVLAGDIDASGTSGWNAGAGFNPIGDVNTSFTGRLDGQGQVISDLTINRPKEDDVGLFGATHSARLTGIGLVASDITGGRRTGSLVGYNRGSISQSYATGDVTGASQVGAGGLVGYNVGGTISQSYATGNVTSAQRVGGLVGYNKDGTISQSYATGDVTGYSMIGGMVGYDEGTISQSYATGNVSGTDDVGGLVGFLVGSGVPSTSGTINQSYATGDVSGDKDVGGLAGTNFTGTISQSYATGDVRGDENVGGLTGLSAGTIRQSYATGDVTGSQNIGGLLGTNESTGTIENSFFATTDAAGTPINHSLNPVGLNDKGRKTNTSGKTLAELQELATFVSWGADIDAEGGTGSVWRLYEGHSTPLLRSFLTTLDVNPADATVTYNGANQTGPSIWRADAPHDASLILGTGIVSGGGTDAGDHAVELKGLYSSQQGYDLIQNSGTLTVQRRPVTVAADHHYLIDNNPAIRLTWQTGCGAFSAHCGLVEGELLAGQLEHDAGNGVGQYTIQQGTITDSNNTNYAITFEPGELVIAPMPEISLPVNKLSSNMIWAMLPRSLHDSRAKDPLAQQLQQQTAIVSVEGHGIQLEDQGQ